MSISERRRLLHLSDLHLNARNQTRYGVDPDASLRAVLATCAELEAVIAVVVTGDIADQITLEEMNEDLAQFALPARTT